MKILYHHRTRAEDGQAVHIRALMEAFRSEGHTVMEAALVQRDASAAQAGAQSRSLFLNFVQRMPHFALELAEYAYSLPAERRLARSAAAFQPDFLYERYAFGNQAGAKFAQKSKLPFVLEVNSPMVHELSRTRGLVFPGMAQRVENSILRSADIVAVVSGVLGEMLHEQGVARERLLLTPNGVHLELYAAPDRASARAKLGIPPNVGTVFGFVGYLRDWHRLDLVVQALGRAELREATLCVVGEGPGTATLLAAAERAQASPRVRLAGSFPHAVIPSLLPAFDVALVPAINPYASPLKLFEYMAAGLAVIAPDQPNLREVLQHEQNALLVQQGDADAMAAALLQLVRSPDLAQRLGQAARATIVERDLTWRGNARRVVQAVEALHAP